MPMQARHGARRESDDSRAEVRRDIFLEVCLLTTGRAQKVLVHNVSVTGILFQCNDPIKLNERVQFEVPHSGKVDAIVRWANDGFLGCEFSKPISAATVSAFLLKSSFDLHSPGSVLPPAPISQAAVQFSQDPPRADQLEHLTARGRAFVILGLAAASWAVLIGVSWALS